MFKAYLYQEGIHNHNPTLFKRVNDIAKTSNFTKEWTKDEFTSFFMAQDLLSKKSPPSIYGFVLLFELLDE